MANITLFAMVASIFGLFGLAGIQLVRGVLREHHDQQQVVLTDNTNEDETC